MNPEQQLREHHRERRLQLLKNAVIAAARAYINVRSDLSWRQLIEAFAALDAEEGK